MLGCNLKKLMEIGVESFSTVSSVEQLKNRKKELGYSYQRTASPEYPRIVSPEEKEKVKKEIEGLEKLPLNRMFFIQASAGDTYINFVFDHDVSASQEKYNGMEVNP